jgi:hypothetical protein
MCLDSAAVRLGAAILELTVATRFLQDQLFDSLYSYLQLGHSPIMDVPEMITHCAPISIVQDPHPPTQGSTGSTNRMVAALKTIERDKQTTANRDGSVAEMLGGNGPPTFMIGGHSPPATF